MTGDEYIETCATAARSICTASEVKDVTTHPAFRNPVRMTARPLRRPAHRPPRRRLTVPTDTGNGGVDACRSSRRRPRRPTCSRSATPIARWARMTWGWMGRIPRLQGQRSSAPCAPTRSSTRRSRTTPSGGTGESQEKVLYWNHAIINPPVDRRRAARRGRRRLHEGREGDRRRADRVGGEGRGHRLGAHQLQLHRALRPADHARSSSR